MTLSLPSLFEPVFSIHCLAALHLGRCWAAIQLFQHPEPSSHAVHGEVDGFDFKGQHGRRFVLLRHTYRPQRRQARAETSDIGAEAVKPNPRCSRKVLSRRVGVGDRSAESRSAVQPLHIPSMIRPERCTPDIRQTDELLCGGYKWVSSI